MFKTIVSALAAAFRPQQQLARQRSSSQRPIHDQSYPGSGDGRETADGRAERYDRLPD